MAGLRDLRVGGGQFRRSSGPPGRMIDWLLSQGFTLGYSRPSLREGTKPKGNRRSFGSAYPMIAWQSWGPKRASLRMTDRFCCGL
jgi:hypothetical protein